MSTLATNHPNILLDDSQGLFIHTDPEKHVEPAKLRTKDQFKYACEGCGQIFQRNVFASLERFRPVTARNPQGWDRTRH